MILGRSGILVLCRQENTVEGLECEEKQRTGGFVGKENSGDLWDTTTDRQG